MANHRIMTPNNILENRLFFEFLHNVVWDQLIHELYEGAVLVFHRNYELNTIPAYRRLQLLLIVTEKIKGTKMIVLMGRWYFVVQKNYDAERKFIGFFYQ